MLIILDNTLERQEKNTLITEESVGYHRRKIANAVQMNRPLHIGSMIDPDAEELRLGYLDLLSFAYSRHEIIRVAPHDLWFVFLGEIAKIVNKNSKVCRLLFTTAEDGEKVEILVPTTDPTTIDPMLIMAQLQKLVPTDSTLFVPNLSTMNLDSKIAMAAMFADAVQSYYNYSTFLCGIPAIEVTGTVEDWQTVTKNSLAIGELLQAVGLEKEAMYCVKVSALFALIGAQVMSGEISIPFWKDIFTSKNVGSGGDLRITGWITDLFFEKPEDMKFENFLSSYAVLPYKNLETNRQFKAVYGAFEQHRTPGGVLYSGYAHHIYEVPAT